MLGFKSYLTHTELWASPSKWNLGVVPSLCVTTPSCKLSFKAGYKTHSALWPDEGLRVNLQARSTPQTMSTHQSQYAGPVQHGHLLQCMPHASSACCRGACANWPLLYTAMPTNHRIEQLGSWYVEITGHQATILPVIICCLGFILITNSLKLGLFCSVWTVSKTALFLSRARAPT